MTTPHTYRLERRQFILRPRADVFDFFSDASNLEAITPPSVHFHILTPRPIVLQEGTLIDYRLRLLGVPMKWRTRIESFEPPCCFSDTQVRGPYKLWRHTHEFHEQDGGTLMIDRVAYQLSLGPIGWAANALFVRRQLGHIFDYRYQQIERLLAETRSAGRESDRAPQSVT